MNQENTFHHRVVFVCFAAIVTLSLLKIFVLASDILVLVFFSVLVAIMLSYPVNWFSRKMPRLPALLLTLLLILASVSAISRIAASKISEQGRSVIHQIPQAREKAESWMKGFIGTNGGNSSQNFQPRQVTQQAIESAISKTFPAALGAVTLLGALMLTMALASFLVYRAHECQPALCKLLPARAQADFDAIWVRLDSSLRHWLKGVLISMTITGAMTTLGLRLIGIEAWLFLGMVTFLAAFVPYAGAVASGLLGLMFALAQSPRHFAYALAVYVGVHIFEGYIIEPVVMRKTVQINPALLLIWQALAGAVMGVTGILISTPLLVCAQEIVIYWRLERPSKVVAADPSRKAA